MKRLLGLLMLLVFVLTGCVGTKRQRGVQENTFYSTYPEVAVKMAPEFEYVDNRKKSEYGQHEGSDSGSSYNNEKFIFADRLSKKVGVITISSLSDSGTRWIVDLTKQISDYLTTGYEDQFGKTYQYIVFTSKDENNECRLIKLASRVVGGYGDTILNIIYVEPLYGLSLNCENEKLKLSELSLDQKKFYDEFMERCSKNMKFIDIASLNLNQQKSSD